VTRVCVKERVLTDNDQITMLDGLTVEHLGLIITSRIKYRMGRDAESKEERIPARTFLPNFKTPILPVASGRSPTRGASMLRNAALQSGAGRPLFVS